MNTSRAHVRQSRGQHPGPVGDPSPGDPGRSPPGPFTARIAGWSARHRKTAVFGWLALVAVIFVAGQVLGTKSLPVDDAGQSGQAEQTLYRLGIAPPAVEDVLIQPRMYELYLSARSCRALSL